MPRTRRDTGFRQSGDPAGPRGRFAGSAGRNGDTSDLKGVDSLIFAQALRLSLVNSEPIDIVVENFRPRLP